MSVARRVSRSFSSTPSRRLDHLELDRSLPSRVRSPTPANTEKPPWSLGDVADELEQQTVLPTPAPPNRPILPPRRYGASRSMTLMPVSKISTFVDCSTNGGGAGGSASASWR
jgi:hypothetical protein